MVFSEGSASSHSARGARIRFGKLRQAAAALASSLALVTFLVVRAAVANPPGITWVAAADGCSDTANRSCGIQGTSSNSIAYTAFDSSGTEANPYMVVGVAMDNITTSVTSVNYRPGAAQVPLTFIGAVNSTGGTKCRVELWGGVYDNPGTNRTVRVYTSGSVGVTLGMMAFHGVRTTGVNYQSRFYSNTGSGIASNSSVTSNTAQADFVFDTVCANGTSGVSITTPPNAPHINIMDDIISASGLNEGVMGIRYAAASPATTTVSSYAWDSGSNVFWAGGAVSLTHANNSAITLVGFDAFPNSAGGVRVGWRTGLEVDNLGFHIYRDDGAQRTRLTASPIIGSALLTGSGTTLAAGRIYAWDDDLDADARGNARYWLEEIDLDGHRTMYGPASVKRRRSPADFEVVVDGAQALNTRPAAALHRAAVEAPPAPAAEPPLSVPVGKESPLQWATAARAGLKVGIDHEGWYELTATELLAAGLDPATDPRTLSLSVEGQELPLRVRGGDDGHLDPGDSVGFFGRGLNAPTTDTRIYWLVAGDRPGRRLQTAIAATAFTPTPDRFMATIESRPREIYFAALHNGDRSNFFGPMISTSPVTQTLHVRHALPGDVIVEVGAQGVSDVEHRVAVEAAGVSVGTVAVNNSEYNSEQFAIAIPLPGTGDVDVTLRGSGVDTDVSLVDFVRLAYPRAYVADEGRLRFTAPAGAALVIPGFTPGESVDLFDVTDEMNPQAVTVADADSGGAVTFVVPGQDTRTLLAQSSARRESVRALVPNQPSQWNAAQAGGDLLVIGRRDLLSGMAPLAQLREAQGWKMALVDIDDVYDEFSFGAKHPDAIRSFIARTRTIWSRAPRAVILLGDATLDPRVFLGKGDFDLVPTKLIDTEALETSSDDWFADFDGDGIADIPVGRLPARTPAEVAAIVNKLITAPTFGSLAGAAAAGPVVFVNDKADDLYDFHAASRRLQDLLPPAFRSFSVDRDLATVDPVARLRELMLERPLVVSYVGHGSQDLWAGGVLSSDSVAQLGNTGAGAFWTELTCFNGFFQDVYRPSLAEALLTQPQGGAFGIWASSGYTDLANHEEMGRAFMENLTARGMTVGEAARQAKTLSPDNDVRRTWILFGDPTWRLYQPAVAGDASAPSDTGDAAAADASTPPDAGASTGHPDVSFADPLPIDPSSSAGCSCSLAQRAARSEGGWLLLASFAVHALRRRRRRTRG